MHILARCLLVAPLGACAYVSVSPLQLEAVSPSVADPQGGSRLILRGSGLAAASSVEIGGVPVASFEVLSDHELRVYTAPLPAGDALSVRVIAGDKRAELPGAVDAWSPALLPGARLFDAASGVEAGPPGTQYEWQRLTPSIAPDWRARDGNTLSWLPSTGRFWMVGGWNGYQAPQGFSPVPPDEVYPPLNTTDEVWSSVDGASWTLELPHGHGQFERRHSHNTILWNDRLWMIGGDMHQGYYNHDVVFSEDGLTWTAALPPGSPPWEPRALQMSGVFQGRLWTMGGQESHGDAASMRFFNDVWVSDDGVNWQLVAPNAPASETRWAGCGAVDSIVEFRGEMWLVGCGRDTSSLGAETRNEVWSSADGLTWRRHATPPWAGKIWQNVLVWDDRLWLLFGYTLGDPERAIPPGQESEVWYSDDGEVWTRLPADAPAPGSHAQGIAAREDFLLYAGGNYSYGFGAGEDKSAWRLVPFRGVSVDTWTARGERLTVRGTGEARPLWLPDAFGPGAPGLHFDGSTDFLGLDAPAPLPEAYTMLWVARAPFLPAPYGWEEIGAPVATVVGGPSDFGLPTRALGLSDGEIVLHTLHAALGPSGEFVWERAATGSGLQEGPGQVHLAGLRVTPDQHAQGIIDGRTTGAPFPLPDSATPSWSQLGGGLSDSYHGPNSRFGGTLGAVLIAPAALDDATLARIQAWALSRFF